MKYLHEYRSSNAIKSYLSIIEKTATQPWTIMEICGGQTHSIVKFGLNRALPTNIHLVHGPGCPVCVTPEQKIDAAITISQRKNVILCSFGDMLRVPGTQGSLIQAKTDGSDIRIVYSPLDALRLAEQHPEKEIVFLAVGFETTAPANAMSIHLAKEKGIQNFSVILSHVLVPPAMRAILANPKCEIKGFLAAGHVCTIMGYQEYHKIAEEFAIPIVVTGFEPVDILEGISRCTQMLEAKNYGVCNQYSRSVKENGNQKARSMLEKVFTTVDMVWRGIGNIPNSGYKLSKTYEEFDAELRFNVNTTSLTYRTECKAGEVLQGFLKPFECPHFGSKCHPESPMGAPMVSSEGACAAYYHYAKHTHHS